MSQTGAGPAAGLRDTMADFVELAREGEAAGMESMYTVEAGRSALCVGCRRHCCHRAGYRRHLHRQCVCPGAVADGDRCRDLDEMSGGRFTLGLGTGNRHFKRVVHGCRRLPAARQAARLHQDRAQRRGWPGGEPVRYEGDHHRIAGGPPGADSAVDSRVPVGLWAQDGPPGRRGGRRRRRWRDVVGRNSCATSSGPRRNRPPARQAGIPTASNS